MIEIVDRGAYMARDQVKKTSGAWSILVACERQGQMFLARLFRNQVRPAHDQTMWHTAIDRNCLVSGIAGDNSLARLTDDARDDERSRRIPSGQLLQASHVAVDNGSG